ncbi:MAG TPA: hypothetical protein QF550_00050, partial [Arenicellales bacterium]|nr:hypothetical protein [Arenicellales bacterium]
MSRTQKNSLLFLIMLAMVAGVGIVQSWNVALTIFNLCLISAIMSLGVNIQWGYAGLFNAGVMGFAALGGLAAIIISSSPVAATWEAGGMRAILGLLAGLFAIIIGIFTWKKTVTLEKKRYWPTMVVAVVGYALMRLIIDPAISTIEAIEPAKTGYLGGFNQPILLSWLVGGIFAAAAAWVVG